MTTVATAMVPGVLDKASDGITAAQAAAKLGVTRATINNWIKQGKLPATRFGGTIVRIDPADLDKLREPA